MRELCAPGPILGVRFLYTFHRQAQMLNVEKEGLQEREKLKGTEYDLFRRRPHSERNSRRYER